MFQDVYDGFICTTLPNGLTVYTQQRSVSWVYVGVVVHAGAKEDPVGRQGLAHLVEHLVSENIEGLSFSMLEQRFQTLGAAVHFGSTSYVSTEYDFHVPANGVLAERLAMSYLLTHPPTKPTSMKSLFWASMENGGQFPPELRVERLCFEAHVPQQ